MLPRNLVHYIPSKQSDIAEDLTLHLHCYCNLEPPTRVLVGKPEGKRPLRRPRRRWEDNIKMDIQEVGGSRGDWMEDIPQDRDGWCALVGAVRNLRVPKMRGIS
jgi:hypothetical protein